jgi:PPOX class probable F420-dependent enzyme
MELRTALDHARSTHNGVLVTIKRDGRPQLSNIMHAVGDDGLIRISVTGDRAKAVNLRRDPRASLYVGRDDHWAYAVIEATAELTAEAADPHDATVDALVALYRSFGREHPDWDEYRSVMAQERRLVVTLHPERAYGMGLD